MNTTSQSLQIIRYLAKGRTLTALQALNRFGVWRLSGRILDLRKDRWPIETRMVKTPSGKRVAEYFLPKSRRAS